MKKEFNLNDFKKQQGIKDYVIGQDYEMYQSHFPEMDYTLFCILDRNGMKGRLWRGQPIDLPWENIHIPACWWRYEIFLETNHYVCYNKKETL